MFMLSPISNSLELWSAKHTSIYENPESNVFRNIKFLGKISSSWPNVLLGTNVYRTLEFC